MTHLTPSDAQKRLLSPAKLVLRRWKQRNALTIFVAAGVLVAAIVLWLRLAGSTFPALPFVFAGGTFALLMTMMVNRGAGGRLLWLIDRSAARQQAYATATRLSLDVQDPGPVGRVLLRDEAENARTIDARAIIAFPGLPAIGGAIALLVLIGINFWLADQRAAASNPVDVPVAETVPEDTPALSDALNDVATRMAESAAETQNEYLAAVARALAEKADALADAPDDEALQQDIADLLEHARRAYGDTPPSWLGQSGDFSTQQVAANFEDQLAQEARAAQRATERAEEGYVDIYARDDARLERLYSGRDADELISSVEGEVRMADNDLAPGTAPDEGASPRRMEDAELEMIGGAPVGAAMESGKGDSNLAGGGSQDMQDDTTPEGPAVAGTDDMTLTSNPEATGNRIRIDAAPPAAGEGDGTPSGGVAGRFDATEIARAAMGAARTEIPASARSLVARYLDRSSAGQDTSANGSAE